MKTKFGFLFCFLLPLTAAPQDFSPSSDAYRALASISSDSLRGNLSFLASDLLEGRDTPSRGLDLAAEYIAAQFRKAGLEPAGDDGYFQTARMLHAASPGHGFVLRLSDSLRTISIPRDQTIVINRRPLELSGAPVYKIGNAADPNTGAKGRVVLLDGPFPDVRSLAALRPVLFLKTEDDDTQAVPRRLFDPGEEETLYGGVPRLIVRDKEAVKMLKDAKEGETGLKVSLKLPPGVPEFVTVRNVAGLLRGSDSALLSQYVLLTAHYDHIGRNGSGEVRPGANDDGSGVVSVIEIGQALAGARVHTKRSVMFMVFFGEEEGSLGARYYTAHPLVPLARTVADVNLEQVGRTDSNSGPEISNATLTGFRYSTVPQTLRQAGELTGVKVYETLDGDQFFSRSDNLPFAEHGIPAHTLAVAFEFPDYHAAGDTWPKIDYGNMAKVDRTIAMGVAMLADSPEVPRWNADNPSAAEYMKLR